MKQSRIKALYRLERELKGDGYEVVMRIRVLRKTLIMVILVSCSISLSFRLEKIEGG